MKDTPLYEHLLWTEIALVGEVVLKPGQVWADPTDSTKRAHINGWHASGGIWIPVRLRPSSKRASRNSNTATAASKNWPCRGRNATAALPKLMEAFVVKLLLGTLSPAQRDGVNAVAMDMWPAFMSAATACVPQADIVHDRFHVAK